MKCESRHIVHVDMDAFFVSVERLLEPSLAGKPVIVGGNPNGRGVVASASYEARAFGVHSAMPLAQARRLCPQALFIEGRYGAYGEYSDKIRAIFESYSPLVQMGSLDEAYIDLTGTERLHGSSPWRIAEAIHERVAREVGLPCSLGLASNRLVAKVASDLAKPNGLLYVVAGAERAFLAPLALRRLPGIGPHTAERLQLYGLRTIGDIPRLGEHALEELFGSYGIALYQNALGSDDSAVAPDGRGGQKSPRQGQVGREHTFDEDTCDPAQILATLSYLSEKVAAELREMRARAKTLTLKLRYSDFKTITRSVTLNDPTDDECEFFRVGNMLFEKSYMRRVRIRLVGISASNLYNEGWQRDLLENARLLRRERLHASLDAVRRRYGFPSILHAASFCFLSVKNSLGRRCAESSQTQSH